MLRVPGFEGEASGRRERDGRDARRLADSPVHRRHVGCSSELALRLGWSEPPGTYVMCFMFLEVLVQSFSAEETWAEIQSLPFTCLSTRRFFSVSLQGICMMILVLQVVQMPNIKVR